jgi:hypothetical protein
VNRPLAPSLWRSPRCRAWHLVLPFLFVPGHSTGQVVPDSLRAPPDTVQVPPDSALAEAGLQEQAVPGDSINPQDTLPALQLPGLARPTPAGWATGIWEWSRDEILGSKATTLAELVGEVPGTVMLRGGDYGMPVSVSAFGAGGDRIRVFQDGIEVVPLEGSTPDLTRIGLAGLRWVRVVRGVSDLRPSGDPWPWPWIVWIPRGHWDRSLEPDPVSGSGTAEASDPGARFSLDSHACRLSVGSSTCPSRPPGPTGR